MVQNIDLMNVTSNFQARLSDVFRNIKKNPKLLIPADRTNNLHKLTTDEFNKLLTENTSKVYKKFPPSTMHAIDTEPRVIAKDLNLDKRIELYNQKNSLLR